MFSTNLLIAILEWLYGRFEAASNKHDTYAKSYAEVAAGYKAKSQEHADESKRAKSFANKIANFLE